MEKIVGRDSYTRGGWEHEGVGVMPLGLPVDGGGEVGCLDDGAWGAFAHHAA